ncbi:CRISPR-associated endoribonuclease Cas6 [Sulfolobus acidocaldarius]|uniref:CRISPR-associated endoribonuclease Cas6 n=1 Tax=Sulfolobus acidocaldarius TaxID=2285 RepID=UPI000AF80A17|nr:CRISPR-associated endoribonuclease Cas6 [Sulfolobus acidocaldarius]
MIFYTSFEITTDHDIILPPFTSKLSRLILVKLSDTYSKLQYQNTSYKPLRVTVIKDPEGRPVYARGRGKSIINGNQSYSFTFSFQDENIFREIMEKVQTTVEAWNTKFQVNLKDIKVVDQTESLRSESKLYRMEFLTPTLLQPIRPNLKRKDNRFVLFPYVPILLFSIVKHWNQNMDQKIHGVTGLKTLYYMREVDYRLRPVTTYYDGKPVRGFTGWTVFELRSKRNSKITRNVQKLLEYANYFGVGKSRAIGFGEVNVKVIDE